MMVLPHPVKRSITAFHLFYWFIGPNYLGNDISRFNRGGSGDWGPIAEQGRNGQLPVDRLAPSFFKFWKGESNKYRWSIRRDGIEGEGGGSRDDKVGKIKGSGQGKTFERLLGFECEFPDVFGLFPLLEVGGRRRHELECGQGVVAVGGCSCPDGAGLFLITH